MADRWLNRIYRLFPPVVAYAPMDKCKHPYCVLLNRRERRARVAGEPNDG